MMRIKAHMLMILSLQLSLSSVYGFLNLGSSLISPNKPFSRVEKPQELFAHTNNKSDGSLFSSFLNQLSNDRNNNNTMKQKEIPSKNQQTSRRNALLRFAVVATTASTTMDIMSSLDNGNIARAADTKSTIWLTGKAPKVPGEKPKDKNDTKGTRKGEYKLYLVKYIVSIFFLFTLYLAGHRYLNTNFSIIHIYIIILPKIQISFVLLPTVKGLVNVVMDQMVLLKARKIVSQNVKTFAALPMNNVHLLLSHVYKLKSSTYLYKLIKEWCNFFLLEQIYPSYF